MARRHSAMLRHPRRVLALSGIVVVFLGVLGLGLDEKLSPTTLDISGTSASRANELLREHFGDNATFPILLQGPAAAIDRQGPELVRTLRRENPRVTTLSPWDRGLGRAPATRSPPSADHRRLPCSGR